MTSVLDNLNGYQFEELMVDVFRKLGYENPRVHKQGADEGRDIVMEEVVDERRRGVVVECKHQATVSRPVVQKLHSAVSTYAYDGPKRGIVVTTGRFTSPAEEYADKVAQNGGGETIELIDGSTLRSIGEQIGLDLYNGRIEILCDQTLHPYDPMTGLDRPMRERFTPVENLSAETLTASQREVMFIPVLDVVAKVDATFSTSVGVIHRVNESNRFTFRADEEGPQRPQARIQRLVTEHIRETRRFDENTFDDDFDIVHLNRFERTETEYNEWIIEQVRDAHTTTVNYTGGNNVDYSKECRPNVSDVQIQAVTPVYLPVVRHEVRLGEYTHPVEYAAAGAASETLEDPIRCVHCDEDAAKKTYTFCENCGSINCPTHTKTERLEETPVCTGCAVTESFMWSTKHFYDAENLDTFRGEYEQMPVHRKIRENTVVTVAVILVLFSLLVGGGLVLV